MEQNRTTAPLSKKSDVRPWVIFFCAGAFYLYEYILRVSPSVIADDLMMKFDLTSLSLGVLVSLYYWAYVPLQIPCGYILDRYGVRNVITISAFICTLGSFAFVCTHHYYLAVIGRIMMGAGSACAYVACMKVGSDWFSAKKFALITGLTLMMGTLGATFGVHPFALAVKHYGFVKALWILSYMGVFITVLCFFTLKDNEKITKSRTPILKSLTGIIKSPNNWILGAYGCLMYVGISGFAELWSVNALMQKCAIPRELAASMSVAFFFGIAIGSPVVTSMIESYFDRIKAMSSIAFIAAFIFTLIIYVDLNVSILTILLLVNGALCGGHVLCFVCAKNSAHKSQSATVMGFVNALVMMSGLIFQPLIGYILDWQWEGDLCNDGTRFYATDHYQTALSAVIIGYIIAGIVVRFYKPLKSN